jgi:hypothetical protein
VNFDFFMVRSFPEGPSEAAILLQLRLPSFSVETSSKAAEQRAQASKTIRHYSRLF